MIDQEPTRPPGAQITLGRPVNQPVWMRVRLAEITDLSPGSVELALPLEQQVVVELAPAWGVP